MRRATTIRTLIVDDSAAFRVFLRRCLDPMDEFEIVGTASDGQMALHQIEALKPELVSLDMEMPNMHGLEVLRQLQENAPQTKVIVVSSATKSDAERTFEALEAGACDFIIKPTASEQNAQGKLMTQFRKSARVARSIRAVVGGEEENEKQVASVVRPARELALFQPDIVAIGSSTGGPAALGTVIAALPGDYSLPITITQHMPKSFVQSLATRLDRESRVICLVAEQGMVLQKSHVYLAPGEMHMEIERQGTSLMVQLCDGPRVNHCKPSVDKTFYSLAKHSPTVKTLAVVLTGMGADGAAGAKAIMAAKGYVVAQDEATSAVWGMPGATVKMGAAHDILPLDQIASALMLCAPNKFHLRGKKYAGS